ncbi:MAG: DUF3293 domain-containing protein [Alphaproteobacteria bacterium]
MESSSIAPDKLAAYEATHYRIGMDATAPVLRIGLRAEELARMHVEAGVACSLFITAWNPLGAQVPDEENRQAHEELRAALAARAPRIVEGAGGEPGSDWPEERSFLALGIDEDEARRLGRRFRQDAVVWMGADAVPRLLLLR